MEIRVNLNIMIKISVLYDEYPEEHVKLSKSKETFSDTLADVFKIFKTKILAKKYLTFESRRNIDLE